MEERQEFAIKADSDYKAFIIKSIRQVFKTPEQSQTFYTVEEILAMFRGDYYARDWFEAELKNLGYQLKDNKYRIELKNPLANNIKI